MGGMKLSNLDFVRLLPAFMRDDEAVIALSEALNSLMGGPGERLSTLRTWDKIDELSEAECDELAWELDIDWYDSAGMSLEEKRNTIKVAQQIKRKRGTKWAVERLVSAYFGEGFVLEWYEMEGTPYAVPYTFLVLTTETQITDENFDKFMEAALAAKNERSHLAGVFYYWQQGPEHGVGYMPFDSIHFYDFVKCGTRYRIATTGGKLEAEVAVEPETYSTLYDFPECGIDGEAATLGAAVVGTAIVNVTRLRRS